MTVRSCVSATVVAATLAILPGVSQAVVKHAADDAAVIPAPNANVVGRWGTNASAVAINPNYIITAGHPGGGVGTQVVFGGTPYNVAQIFNHPTADLRIARIETLSAQPANLADYVPVYSTPIGVITNFTMVGFGKSRGTDLTTTGGTYGYNWLNEANTTERFGRNRIESASTGATGLGFTSDVYEADFDGVGVGNALIGESIMGEFDSGGGWFIEDGPGNWKVAAISRAVGHFGFAQFASASNATVAEPDGMDAVNLSSYTTFINTVVPEPGSATLLLAGAALVAMRRRR